MIVKVENKTNKEILAEMCVHLEPRILRPGTEAYIEPYNPAEHIRRIDINITER